MKPSLHESQEEPRGERDVIRLRNPTEDERAFRQMLTSADRMPGANTFVGACAGIKSRIYFKNLFFWTQELGINDITDHNSQ